MARKAPRIGMEIKYDVFNPKTFVAVFKQKVGELQGKMAREIAGNIKQEALAIIENQAYNWKPLSEKYLDWKIKENLDPRILIATGFYREHIAVWKDRKGSVHVGVKPKVIHEPSGLPLTTLARIHEFGTETIPARPLWRPLLSKWIRAKKRLATMYRKRMVAEINKDLEKKKVRVIKATTKKPSKKKPKKAKKRKR